MDVLSLDVKCSLSPCYYSTLHCVDYFSGVTLQPGVYCLFILRYTYVSDQYTLFLTCMLPTNRISSSDD